MGGRIVIIHLQQRRVCLETTSERMLGSAICDLQEPRLEGVQELRDVRKSNLKTGHLLASDGKISVDLKGPEQLSEETVS